MKRALIPYKAGFSLIELLVAMVIGLVVTLAITSVLIRGEGAKRSTTSVNDLNQNGAYAAYLLDRVVRSAGSGFSQSWSTSYGCLLSVSQGSAAVLPLPAALPASSAFARVTQPIRLAPVIIGKGLADTTGTGAQVRGDVLVVMGGTGGFAEMQQSVTPASVSGTGMSVQNALGYGTDDLVLLADAGVPAGCMLQQVGTRVRATSGPSVQFGGSGTTYYGGSGTYVATTTSPVAVTAFGGSTIALQLGNAASNAPQFRLYGVGANNTLVSYDLLQPGPQTDSPLADGVVEMRAIYGLDTATPPSGVVNTWVDPIAGSGYEPSVLTDGSPGSRLKLRQIAAIRLGFILRTSLAERPQDYQPTLTTLTLFGDLGGTLPQTRVLSTSELNYRFRTVEVTVPLRNVLLAPQS
jgi:type IV pilus assembly protein PilW